MRVIFLDDDENRQRQMKSMLPVIKQVYTADEAINEIDHEGFIDCLFLDHDLGGEIYVDSSVQNTGAAVAKWIVANVRQENIGRIVLHSFNPVGAQNMYQTLSPHFQQVDISPFLSMRFKGIVRNLSKGN